jgi:RHS repeat-associated protein
VAQTYKTDPFGAPTDVDGTSSQPFGYAGEQTDVETGLVNLRARMYDPQLGRFIQRDRFGGRVSRPDSLNRYAYGLNNPLSQTDPSGFDADDANAGVGEYSAESAPEADVTVTIDSVSYDDGDTTEAVVDSVESPSTGEGDWGEDGVFAQVSGPLVNICRCGYGHPGAINITAKGRAHVVDRHTVGGSQNAGKSHFSPGENIDSLIQQSQAIPAVRQTGGNFERVVDAGRPIGIDRVTGQPTSIYTVITNAQDDLITAFPGVP